MLSSINSIGPYPIGVSINDEPMSKHGIHVIFRVFLGFFLEGRGFTNGLCYMVMFEFDSHYLLAVSTFEFVHLKVIVCLSCTHFYKNVLMLWMGRGVCGGSRLQCSIWLLGKFYIPWKCLHPPATIYGSL